MSHRQQPQEVLISDDHRVMLTEELDDSEDASSDLEFEEVLRRSKEKMELISKQGP